MSETTLRVEHEMILPEDLKYTKFNTDTVKNLVEMQTLEKAFVRYPATSLDSSSITWNLPSISGGAMVRQLEVEVPINFTITFRGVAPNFEFSTAFPIAVNDPTFTRTIGSPPRAFMTEMNCLDQAPLSKIFGSREYTINNSSTILKEDFSPEQIDAMIAQADLKKIRNAGLEPFADANSHFTSLVSTWGGVLAPFTFRTEGSITANNTTQTLIAAVLGVEEAVTPGISAALSPYFYAPDCVDATCMADTWAAKRNRARNIVSSSVSIVASTGANPSVDPNIPGCGYNAVPWAGNGEGQAVALYDDTRDWVCTFKIVVREQLWSQFFDHEHAFNRFQWNRMLPTSSLNLKFNINSTYLQQAVLKIGDDIASIVAAGGAYTISAPTVGTQNECILYVHQAKIPLALLPRQSYKVLYYAQDRPQGRKAMVPSAATRSFTANMQYANLSQIPEYLMIYLPINKTAYQANVANSGSSPYQLPSTFNLPITSLVLTFNQDTALATHGLDMYTLQQYTMENLQNLEDLEGLIVGEGKPGCLPVGVSTLIRNGTVGTLAAAADRNGSTLAAAAGVLGSWKCNKRNYNGISNSSFYLLKLGSQIRLPEGYAPGMIVNYNLEVTATCDLSQVKRAYGDVRSDVQGLFDTAANFPNNFNALAADLEVIHFNKRIFTLSGDAMQNVYVHNVQITSAEFLALRNQFQSSFPSMSKDDVFDARMMIGGGMLSRIKDKAVSALHAIAPRVRSAVEMAKKAVPADSDLRKFVDRTDEALGMIGYGHGGIGASAHSVLGGADAHDVMGAAKRGRKPAAKVAKSDWRKYLQGLH